MTPSMGMAAPKGMAPAAPQAGLAAIAQPAQAPKGMSSGNMAQVMAMARKMSDAQLADVLQGKSLDVPQYVAMTEAMGRKSLRTAMQGQQAMAQANQPSVKQKLLMGDQPQMQGIQQGMPQMPQQPVMAAGGGLMYADGGPIDMNEGQAGGGIAELPAPNMDAMTMAGGGIVAFDQGGEVPRFNGQASSYVEGEPLTEEQMQQLLTRGSLRRGAEDVKKGLAEQPYFGSQRNRPYRDAEVNALRQAAAAAPKTTLAQEQQQDMENAAPASKLTAAPAAPAPAGGPPRRPPVIDPSAGAPNEKDGLGSTDEFKAYMDTVKKNNADYLSKLEGASAKQREGLAAIKSQGGGEALMAIARGILSKPGLAAGVSAGLPDVMAASANTRKEQRAVENTANDYDLSLAKAQEAAAKGDMESALMFKKMADEAKYRASDLSLKRAALGQGTDAMRNAMFMSQHPQLAQFFPSVGKTSQMSLTDAAKQWNDLPKDNRKYYKELQSMGINNEQDYYRFVNGQLLSATIPGQGAQTRPY